MSKVPSGAQLIHGVLMYNGIGHEFTFRELYEEVVSKDIIITANSVAAYISNAVQRGCIEPIGKTLVNKRLVRKYRIINREAWKFKSAGIGSRPGRFNQRVEPEELPILEADTKSSIAREYSEKIGIPIIEAPISEHSHNDMTGLPELETRLGYDQSTLSDQLVNLAIQVNALENRPIKTLKDYSTNDLIEELKNRVK